MLQVLDIVTSPSPRQHHLPEGRSSVRPRAESTEAAVALHTPPLTALIDLKVRTASAQLAVVAQYRERAKDFCVRRGRGPAEVHLCRIKRENPGVIAPLASWFGAHAVQVDRRDASYFLWRDAV